jgi:plastocyanin
MKRVTGSVVVCIGAGLFTAGALFYEPPTTAPARANIAAVAPSGPYAKNPKTASSATIRISGFAFSAVSAPAGATVTVSNTDGVAHTVTADNGSFDVTVPAKGATTIVAPTKPGSYRFTCSIHPNMHGTLVVR